jgi:hypothetical protein
MEVEAEVMAEENRIIMADLAIMGRLPEMP